MCSYIFTGGIFYGLLTEARKTAGRANRMCNSYHDDTCDNTSLLIKLGAIIGPEFSKKIAKNTASLYKQCQGQGGLSFDTQKFKDKLKNEVNHNYENLLNRTKCFINECLSSNEEIRVKLVKQCYYILSNSTFLNSKDIKISYPTDEKMEISVLEFLNINNYDFSKFLLAVLVITLGSLANNKLGERTFNELFTKDQNTSEYLLNDLSLKDEVTAYNLIFETPILKDDSTISYIDFQKNQKKDSHKKIEEPEIEIIESIKQNQNESNNTQRVINITDHGKYFEHIDTLILKDDD